MSFVNVSTIPGYKSARVVLLKEHSSSADWYSLRILSHEVVLSSGQGWCLGEAIVFDEMGTAECCNCGYLDEEHSFDSSSFFLLTAARQPIKKKNNKKQTTNQKLQ